MGKDDEFEGRAVPPIRVVNGGVAGYTPYSKKQGDFTNDGHRAARGILYPRLFRTDFDRIRFEDTVIDGTDRAQHYDAENAIDRIAHVTVETLKAPLRFTIQERFREPEYARWRDLTVTEWNHNSGLPSELYKITAGMFAYGYFDARGRSFKEVIVVNVASMLLSLCQRSMPYVVERNPRSNQTFIGLPFDKLMEAGVVVFHAKDLREEKRAA